MRLCESALLAGLLLASAQCVSAQSLEHSIVLDDGDPAIADNGFGIVMDPDGIHAYVSLPGELDFMNPAAANNDNVVKLDLAAGAMTGMGQTGLYPEDVAVTHTASGAARHVYVADSTSGTVTCLTPALQPVGTVNLTPCFGGTFNSIFPFGLLVSPDQNRVYVTTTGGCGTVDVIDSDPASVSFNTVVQSFTVPGSGGRPTWWNHPLMVIPTTTYDAGFTLSRGGFAVVDVSNPVLQTVHVDSPALPNHFAFTTEAVVIPGNRVLLSIGNEILPTVYECDIQSGATTRTLDLNTVTGIVLHGLAVSPDQATAVVTSLNGGHSVFFDIATFTITGVHQHGSPTKPNDAVFTPDGSRLAVSLQGTNRVDLLKDLPGYVLRLTAPATVNVGSPLTWSVDNCEAGQPFAIYASLSGAGPQQFGPYTVHLSSPFELIHAGLGDLDGDGGISIVVPAGLGLSGLTVSSQAATVDRDGAIRLSNGRQTLIN
jgi:DNA-binding beta-propeller fold protein YncE